MLRHQLRRHFLVSECCVCRKKMYQNDENRTLRTCSSTTPNTRGAEGPQRSISRTPIFKFSSEAAKPRASIAVRVDFPTPPLPESIKILCFTFCSFSAMRTMSGSGALRSKKKNSNKTHLLYPWKSVIIENFNSG